MAWTVKTLKAYYDQRLHDQSRSIDRRFTDAGVAVTAALNAAKEAVGKAEVAAEKRFDAQNEFRDQLRDQASTFMPRAEAEIRFGNLSDKIDTNTSNIDRTGGGTTASQRFITVGLSAVAILMSIGAIIAVVTLH